MTTFYAIGDIHGMSKTLRAMRKLIIADAERRSGPKVIVYLGDYIDRGPNSQEVISDLMKPDPRFQQVFLKGNHEALALSEDRDMWLDNGGMETLRSYHDKEIPARDKYWMRNLLLFFRQGKWFFVHAGIDTSRPLDKQSSHDLLWMRQPFLSYEGKMPEGVTVVHGHTPRMVPHISENRIGIDTGACFGNALTCAVLSETKLLDLLKVEAVEDVRRRMLP